VRNPNGEIARLLKEDFAQFHIDCCTTGDPEWDMAVELLLAATALYPALLAPETQASAILHAVQFGGEFEQFSAYCHAVASYGDALQPLEVPSLKKQGRSHPKEPSGFVRRWMGSQDASANQRKDALPEHTEYVRQEILHRYSDAMEELNLYKQLNSSIPVIGSVAYCRRALENVHALFDPEAPFLIDEPLPRALLYADLSRLPSLTLGKLGEIEAADQEILNEGLLKLVANGALKMI
jgi:hypothetical protein